MHANMKTFGWRKYADALLSTDDAVSARDRADERGSYGGVLLD